MFDLCPRSALDTYICPALLTAGERLSLSQGASQSHPAGDEEDAASLIGIAQWAPCLKILRKAARLILKIS